MHRGAAAFLHKFPKRLDVIMMDAASANPQPFAFAIFHQKQCHVGVLKFFVGLHGLQISAAKDKAIRAERIGEGMFRQSPPFSFAISRDQYGVRAHQPRNWVADVQQRRDIGAKRTHLGRRQIIAFHAQCLRIGGESLDGEFE